MNDNVAVGPSAGPAKEAAATPIGTEATRSPYFGCGLHLMGNETLEERDARYKAEMQSPTVSLAHILWRNAKQHKSLLEQQYGFGGIGGTIKRRAPCVLGCFAGNPDEMTCPYCGQSAPIEKGVARCSNEDCRARISPGDHLTETEKLAHTQWRNAKQLVSLLEKEYGFGKEKPKKMVVVDDPELGLTYKEVVTLEPGMRMREIGKEQPIYRIVKDNDNAWDAVLCEWEGEGTLWNYAATATGHNALKWLKQLAAEGKLEFLDPDPTIFVGIQPAADIK